MLHALALLYAHRGMLCANQIHYDAAWRGWDVGCQSIGARDYCARLCYPNRGIIQISTEARHDKLPIVWTANRRDRPRQIVREARQLEKYR